MLEACDIDVRSSPESVMNVDRRQMPETRQTQLPGGVGKEACSRSLLWTYRGNTGEKRFLLNSRRDSRYPNVK